MAAFFFVIAAAACLALLFTHLKPNTRTDPEKSPVDILLALGGKLWIKGDKVRVYFNDAARLAGLQAKYNAQGTIIAATLNGRPLSCHEAQSLIKSLGTFYFDADSGEIRTTGTDPQLVQQLVTSIHRALGRPVPDFGKK